MSSYNTLIPSDDRFSLKRTWAFGLLYSHSLKCQLIAYGCLSVIAAIMTLMPFGPIAQMSIFSLFGSALAIVYYISPVVLSKSGDTRKIMYMTPALPAEKFVFFMAYFLVVLPTVIFLPVYFAQLIYTHIPSIQTEPLMNLLKFSNDYGFNQLSKILQGGWITLVCFYVVLVCKENRTLKGLLAVFGIMLGFGLIGALFGFAIAFFDDNPIRIYELANTDEFNIGIMVDNKIEGMNLTYWNYIMESLRTQIFWLNIFLIGGIILFLSLIYKRIAHSKN